MPNNIDTPVVPEYITVHLGLPDQPAENVRVPFVAYIKTLLRARSTRTGRKARYMRIFWRRFLTQ